MLKKVKSAPKIYVSNQQEVQNKIKTTLNKISDIVGSTLGPSGRVCLIESDQDGIPNKNTKDGVTVFKSLGSNDAYEQLIIEQVRDTATRTASEAGDGPVPLYTNVLTPNGWKKMGDIQVGDTICGTNGTLQKVVGVFPKGQKEILKIHFSESKSVECCEDHLWEVTTSRGKKYIKTTKDIEKDYIRKNDGSKYFIEKTVVDFGNEEELPIDPYTLGVLLGDGSLSDSDSIEISIGLKKEHILSKIKLEEGFVLNTSESKRNSLRSKISGKNSKGQTFRETLEPLGLRNTTSHTKFIPKAYLTSSASNRQQLIQGLIDTDGYINSRGRFEFSSVNERLAKDFQFLAESLGINTMIRRYERKTEYGSFSDRPVYRVTELKGAKRGNPIRKIERTGEFTEMQCIKVSNPDHLYIMDNFITTHNTTSSTILATALTINLLDYCEQNPQFSPQKIVRIAQKVLKEELLPAINEQAIVIDNDNKELLQKVAKVSANGDEDIANAVIDAFSQVGYGASSHVTIQELSGPGGYKVDLIDGYPIPIGYEESIGRFHTAFINDQANLRTILDKPVFLLYDGTVNDLVKFHHIFMEFGNRFATGESEIGNLVFVSHGFSEAVLNELAANFATQGTINIFPLVTPMNAVVNSRLNFLLDLSAFTGAKVFGLKDPVTEATIEDLGSGMETFESYRFRSTLVGDSIPENIEERAEVLKKQLENPESEYAKRDLEERLGKLTNGIAMIKVYAGSAGELKERHDRVEDAVCAVRAAIENGALPGGGRVLLNLVKRLTEMEGTDQEKAVYNDILVNSLMAPVLRLYENAGYNEDEQNEILTKLFENEDLVYDVENQEFGKAEDLGLFDATKAVLEALSNAVSISSVMGVCGGIVAFPRDSDLEREDAKAEAHFRRTLKNAKNIRNPANERA